MKAISVEFSQKDKSMLCIWMLRILNEEQNNGMKKKIVNVGFKNNSGLRLLKYLSQCRLNSM